MMKFGDTLVCGTFMRMVGMRDSSAASVRINGAVAPSLVQSTQTIQPAQQFDAFIFMKPVAIAARSHGGAG